MWDGVMLRRAMSSVMVFMTALGVKKWYQWIDMKDTYRMTFLSYDLVIW